MKKENHKPVWKRWPAVLLGQIALTLGLDLLLGLSLWLGGFAHALCLWVFTPAIGLISACIATRAGFLNYLAFLVPPLCQTAANLILWGYLPEIAPVMVCALFSLVGAAAGEVIKRQHEQQRRKSWKKT